MNHVPAALSHEKAMLREVTAPARGDMRPATTPFAGGNALEAGRQAICVIHERAVKLCPNGYAPLQIFWRGASTEGRLVCSDASPAICVYFTGIASGLLLGSVISKGQIE